MIRVTKPVIAGLLCALGVAACKKGNESYGNVDTTAAKAMDTTSAAAATPTNSPTPPGKWTAPVIVGYAWAANDGEIRVAKIATTKATNAEVRAFAKTLVADHTKMLAETKTLGTTLNATPDTTADDVKDIIKNDNDEVKDLTDKAKGADWDKDFINKEVDGHQKVLDHLNDAAKNNTDPNVTKALTAATAKVQEHLTKAQAIQAKLNK